MSTTASRILIIGCGKLGIRLAERLTANEGEVFGLRRDTSVLPSHITPVTADLRSPEPIFLPEVDSMVITITPSIGGAESPAGYTSAMQRVAEALPAIPQRTVMVSSTGVFDGPGTAMPISETDPPNPSTGRGRNLLRGEVLARGLFSAHIVRPAGIYGPGREMLLRKVLGAEPVNYAQRTNRVHEADLAAVLHAMLARPNPPGLLHAVDQHPAPLGEVVTFIAEELGVPAPPRSTPENPSGKVLDSALLTSWFGDLQFPSYREGYRSIITER